MKQIIKLIIPAILVLSNTFVMGQEIKKEILIFVSFSMNDTALQSYFKEAQKVGAKLVIRGLINNAFQDTQRKMQELKINVDVDPIKFAEYNVQRVPTIIFINGDITKKITGHLPLYHALEIISKNDKSL